MTNSNNDLPEFNVDPSEVAAQVQREEDYKRMTVDVAKDNAKAAVEMGLLDPVQAVGYVLEVRKEVERTAHLKRDRDGFNRDSQGNYYDDIGNYIDTNEG